MAEHANEKQTTNNLPGLTGERVKAGVTIVVTLYALVNAGLSLAGQDHAEDCRRISRIDGHGRHRGRLRSCAGR